MEKNLVKTDSWLKTPRKMKRITTQSIFWMMGTAMLLAMVSGCSKASVKPSIATNLSVMNLAPSVPATTIYLNDTLATADTGIATGQFSTAYAPLGPRSYDIKFKDPKTDSLIYDLASSDYAAGSYYTIILYNNPGSTAAQATKILDDFSTASASWANYRFFNMCPGYPHVDFYMNGVNVQSNRGTADNVTNTTYNSFQNMTPTDYNLEVKVAGTDSLIASSTGVNLAAGGVYTIFFSGQKGSGSNPLTITALAAKTTNQ